jgi:hypothetical protein
LFLVIFGVGASYDSLQLRGPVTTEQDRPPLATELFDPDRRSFVDAAYEWHEGAGLIGEIRSSVAGGTGVEIALERFVEYASAGDPETISQQGSQPNPQTGSLAIRCTLEHS